MSRTTYSRSLVRGPAVAVSFTSCTHTMTKRAHSLVNGRTPHSFAIVLVVHCTRILHYIWYIIIWSFSYCNVYLLAFSDNQARAKKTEIIRPNDVRSREQNRTCGCSRSLSLAVCLPLFLCTSVCMCVCATEHFKHIQRGRIEIVYYIQNNM